MEITKVFSIPEVAAHLKISRAYVYELIAQRKLRASKIGSRTVVLSRDLERFIRALKQRAA